MWKHLVSFGIIMAIGVLPAVGQTRVFDNFDSYYVTDPLVPDQAMFESVWTVPLIQDPFNPNPIVGSLELQYMDPGSIQHGTSMPFSVHLKKCLSRGNILDLTAIAQAIDPGMNGFNGTNENPLHLYAYFDLDTVGKEEATHFFIELVGLDTETCEPSPAPILMPNPAWDPEDPLSPQYVDMKLNYVGEPPDCTAANVTPSVPRSAIAFGFVGGTDMCGSDSWGFVPKPPCDNLVNRMMDTCVLYDGDHWNVLKENFPVTGDRIYVSTRRNRLNMYIKTDTIDITLDTKDHGIMTMNGIPRTYTGGFTAIGIGSRNESAYQGWVDDVGLFDGVLTYVGCEPPTGACCRSNGTCDDDILEENCTGDDIWSGHQACESILCCPRPWADVNSDDDVDQEDFGQWQVCFSGEGNAYPSGCGCYDRDDSTGAVGGDGDVDGTDFLWFTNCFTGPTVPLNLGDLPPGCIP